MRWSVVPTGIQERHPVTGETRIWDAGRLEAVANRRKGYGCIYCNLGFEDMHSEMRKRDPDAPGNTSSRIWQAPPWEALPYVAPGAS